MPGRRARAKLRSLLKVSEQTEIRCATPLALKIDAVRLARRSFHLKIDAVNDLPLARYGEEAYVSGGGIFCKNNPLRASPEKTLNSEGIFRHVVPKNAFRYRFSLEGAGTVFVLEQKGSRLKLSFLPPPSRADGEFVGAWGELDGRGCLEEGFDSGVDGFDSGVGF
jgi:hypothetical protein